MALGLLSAGLAEGGPSKWDTARILRLMGQVVGAHWHERDSERIVNPAQA